MICCKIIFDYKNTQASLKTLFDSLSKHGEFLWDSGALYFADTESDIDEKKLAKLLKKAGYAKFFIDVYTEQNQPDETDYILGWLTNKLITINYNLYERSSQEVFHNIAKGLDLLNQEIDSMAMQAKEQQDASNETK